MAEQSSISASTWDPAEHPRTGPSLLKPRRALYRVCAAVEDSGARVRGQDLPQRN